MAHKRATTKAEQRSAPNDFKGFVSYDLTEDQWQEFDAAFPKTFTAPALWDDALLDNKLTVTPKEGNFNACIWPQTGENSGYGLSAFADSAFEAMAIVLFKFHMVKGKKWSELVKSTRSKRG